MNKFIIQVEMTIEATDILKAIEIGENIASKCVTGAFLRNMIEVKEFGQYKSQTSETNTDEALTYQKATPERIM